MLGQENHAGTVSGCVWPLNTLVNKKTLPSTHKPKKKVPIPCTGVKSQVGSDPNNSTNGPWATEHVVKSWSSGLSLLVAWPSPIYLTSLYLSFVCKIVQFLSHTAPVRND